MGTGIMRMKGAARAAEVAEPTFGLTDFFRAVFRREEFVPVGGEGVKVGEQQIAGIGINEVQRKILDLMIATPQTTAGQIAESAGVTKRHIESNISRLKASGLVERVGADKGGRWVVKLPR
jgi:ATP-dependent DNA helicase RecG